MELRQLTYFQTVAKSGSFSRASALLAVAQPALSRQVRKLEEELGVSLLYRNGRGVTLTEAGRNFLLGVEGILADLERLCGETAEQQGRIRGTVAIGMPPALSGVLIAPLLRRARSVLPHVQIKVIDGFSGHLQEWLLSRQIDMAVLYNAGLSRSIVAEHLLYENLFLLGSPKPDRLRPETGAAATMAEIGRLPLILPGQRHAMRREVDRAAAAAGIRLKIELEVDALQAIKELVMEGRYYSILPFSGISAEVNHGQLKAWRIVEPEVTNEMMLAMAGDRPVTVAMRELARAVRAEFQALLATGAVVGHPKPIPGRNSW